MYNIGSPCFYRDIFKTTVAIHYVDTDNCLSIGRYNSSIYKSLFHLYYVSSMRSANVSNTTPNWMGCPGNTGWTMLSRNMVKNSSLIWKSCFPYYISTCPCPYSGHSSINRFVILHLFLFDFRDLFIHIIWYSYTVTVEELDRAQ